MAKKIENNYLEYFKAKLIYFLKGKFVTFALKSFFKTAVGGGFKVFIVKYISKYLFDEIAEPIIKETFLILGYYYERTKGKILIKTLEEAKRSGNEQAYDDVLSDI